MSGPTRIGDVNPPAVASGDRMFHPMAENDYFSYGAGPEHQFFTGDIKGAPIAPGSNQVPAPPKQDNGTNWANVIVGIPQLGKTVALAGDVLRGYGLDNPITQGMEKYGNMVGNPIGTAVDWYKGRGAFADYGSGQPLDDALAQKGITASGDSPAVDAATNSALGEQGWLSKAGTALGYAGDAYDIYKGIDEGGVKGYANAAKGAADLAGYNIPALGYADAVSKAAKGDVGSAGISAASTAVPLAGLGFLAAGLANKSINAGGDEKRNLSAFLTANPLGIQGMVQPQGNKASGFMSGWLTNDGKVLDHHYMEALAGAYYGAQQGDSEWKKQYDDLLANPVYAQMPKGYSFHDGHYYMGDRMIDTYLNGKKAAHGGSIHNQGVLGQMAGSGEFSTSKGDTYVEGPGTGRSDDIPARLSSGEYVMDAETVAMLGDGSSDAGARRLDELRANLRKHKGKKLAQGKFSDNAKAPAAYLRSK